MLELDGEEATRGARVCEFYWHCGMHIHRVSRGPRLGRQRQGGEEMNGEGLH